MTSKKTVQWNCQANCHELSTNLYPSYDSRNISLIQKNTRRVDISIDTINNVFNNGFLDTTDIISVPICSACIVYVESKCWIVQKNETHKSSGSSASSDSEESYETSSSVSGTNDQFSNKADNTPNPLKLNVKNSNSTCLLSESSDGEMDCNETPNNEEYDRSLELVMNNLERYSELQLAALAKKLGNAMSHQFKVIPPNISTRIKEMKIGRYEDVWQQEPNSILKNLIEGLIKPKNGTTEEQHRKIRLAVKAVDMLYVALNSKHISSLGHAENLLLHHFSGSKTACNLFGRISAAGTYSSVYRTACELAKLPPTFPEGDIIVAYDNNQVIGKQYRVTWAGNQPQSTVTGITVFKDNLQLNLQHKYTFPNVLREGNKLHLLPKYEKFIEEANNINRHYRFLYVENRMKVVQQQFGSDINSDLISINSFADFKIKNNGLEYDRVPPDQSFCEIFDQECVLLNPNSEKTVIKVLDHLVNKAKESSPNRKWFVAVQDGLPYIIALKLLKETRTCSLCGDCNTNMQDHMNNSHRKRDTWANSYLKYESVVLRPGNGHYEINFVRSIFATFFDIYISEMAKMLGFRTPKALEYCRSAADHHKSWMILEILYESLSDELIYVYMKTTNTTDASPTQFFKWFQDHGVLNPNYRLAFDFVFSILHPLFLFRAGIRQCNDKVSLAAREKLSMIFYGFNHPKYREINANDIFLLLSLPKEVLPVVGRQSLRRIRGNIGEGVDFLQEYRNKITKIVLPWEGVPSVEQWRKASCSLQHLDEIKRATMGRLQISESEYERKPIDLSREIFEARKIIREWGKLEGFKDPNQNLVCLSKKRIEINKSFEGFLSHCESNKLKYYNAFLTDRYASLYPLTPFISGNEAIGLTAEKLLKMVRRKIKTLPEPLSTHYLQISKQKVGLDQIQEFDLIINEELRNMENY